MNEKEDFLERMAELVMEDKELHDSFIRLLNAVAEEKEIRNQERKDRKKSSEIS